MNEEYLENIYAYSLSMKVAKTMLESGIISQRDYAKIDKIMAKKYSINLCSLFRENA